MKVSKKQITEARLRAALQRLLDGKPDNVKASAKLTLNRINNEAKLSASYIHKFPEFVKEAELAIAAYGSEHGDTYVEGLVENKVDDSPTGQLKRKLKTETNLKNTYKQQRDDFKALADILVEKEASLMFRVFELQEEIKYLTQGKVVAMKSNK